MIIEVKNDEMLGRTNNTTLHIELIKSQQENKQLKEIIEEVREYTEELKPHWLGNDLVLKIIDDLLQILDKAKGEYND